MDNKVAGGIIGILTLLAGFGGVLYLTQAQQDMAYTCSTTNQVYLCNSLSSTNKTCYWETNGTKQSAVCKNGIFSKTTFKPIEEPEIDVGTRYLCNQYNCTKIR